MNCTKCGDPILPPARAKAGYTTCLGCGDKQAKKEIAYKKTCVAPICNKGAYTYIANEETAKTAGRKI